MNDSSLANHYLIQIDVPGKSYEDCTAYPLHQDIKDWTKAHKLRCDCIGLTTHGNGFDARTNNMTMSYLVCDAQEYDATLLALRFPECKVTCTKKYGYE